MLNLPALLDTYADEDEIGGWDHGGGKWPTGSVWGKEGQYLYSIVRDLRPGNVLELGTFHGCSATHIAAALKRNRKGHLWCVDNGWDLRTVNYAVTIGHMIPDELRDRITIVDSDITKFVQKARRKYDLIFEDGSHDPEQTEAVWSRARDLLNPGGLIISHDAMHFIVGAGIRAAIEALDFEPEYIMPEPSDCGFAIWRKS